MYTSAMNTTIKEICKKNYGFSLFHENEWFLGRTFTFAAVLELIEKIEDLEQHILNLESDKTTLL